MLRTAVVITVLVAGVLLMAGPAGASPPYASPTPVATGPGTQDGPSLDRFGTLLAWEDDSSGNWGVSWGFTDWTKTAAADSSKRHPVIQSSLSSEALVWEDDRNGTWDLYQTAVGTNGQPDASLPPAELAAGPGDQLDPAVSNDTVAYESNAAGDWDICVGTLGSSTTRRLTTSSADQVDPAIDVGTVVWADRRNGNWDIYCHDLAKGTTRRLTSSKADQTAPDIGHGVVVYQDDRNGNWDIYAYTLKTGKERRLTTDRRDQTAPAIGSGRSVVFVDERNAGDIYLYDLKTGAIKPVSDDPAPQAQPDVVFDNVAWTDARDGDPDVYRCTLDYPELGLGGSSDTPPYNSTVEFSVGMDFMAAPEAAAVAVRGSGISRTVTLRDFDESGRDWLTFNLRVVRKVTLTASYGGDTTHLPAAPSSFTVKPFASLSRPSLRYVPGKVGRLVTLPSVDVSGMLRPSHKAGTRAVQIQVWRRMRVSGADWELSRTVKVSVHDQNGASAYSAKSLQALALMYEYKFRAVHADADHTRTESAFSPVIRYH